MYELVSQEVQKWSPRKGTELVTGLALRKGRVGVGLEHLAMLQLEKQVRVFFGGLPGSSHSSGPELLSYGLSGSSAAALGNAGTVLYKHEGC